MEPTVRGATCDPRVQMIVGYQRLMAAGNLAAARRVFAPDVEYSVPGNNVLSGHYVGPDAVMRYFGTLMELTSGSYRISDMLWTVNGESVVLVTRNHATICEQSLAL